MLKEVARRLLRMVDRWRYPREVVVDEFLDSGVRFEVTNPTEAYRVEEYGGEREFLAQLLGEIREGDVFFDIGSCVGLMTVHAALAGAEVYAFEPDPGFRGRLQHNLDLNGIDEVTVLPYAVSDESGRAVLRTEGVSGNSPHLGGDDAESGPERVEVETVSIDELIGSETVPRPDIIKLDIEGAEAAALCGMERTLQASSGPRTIFLEIHPQFLPRFDSDEDEVASLLERAGFTTRSRREREEQYHCVYRRRQG